ncbi:hypothetical protein [Xylanibacter muris]|uniref:Uncharacterized protein n=1 Tax=Xylanibacter muris TaxID=2736290 RepID=A0ABX2ANQ9_9BACT|nr:hypothetical protein [Xylanibacter muris]NPD92838.1 hypothetical protein [Xylanibacter muris]
MKRLKTIFCTILLATIGTQLSAQEYAMTQVSQFANYLSKWSSTQRAEYRFQAEELCNGTKKAIVSDEFSHIINKKDNPNAPYQKSYELETYLNNIGKLVNKGAIKIIYSDIRKVSKKDLAFNSNISEKDLRVTEIYSCKLQVTGAIQHEADELFYVYKDKIAKIDVYRKKDGKVVIDFDDFLNDCEGIGFSYNYGKHFPVGGSFNYSFADIPFMLSVDFGVNLDRDKYIIDKVEMKDIVNYDRNKKIFDPRFFITVTPQFYMKYFALGCGVGVLCMDGKEYSAYYSSTTSTGSSSVIVSGGTITEDNSNILVKPMIRPVAKAFIPLISDELFFSVSIGYDLVFGYKEKNGINFGLGVHWEYY